MCSKLFPTWDLNAVFVSTCAHATWRAVATAVAADNCATWACIADNWADGQVDC